MRTLENVELLQARKNIFTTMDDINKRHLKEVQEAINRVSSLRVRNEKSIALLEAQKMKIHASVSGYDTLMVKKFEQRSAEVSRLKTLLRECPKFSKQCVKTAAKPVFLTLALVSAISSVQAGNYEQASKDVVSNLPGTGEAMFVSEFMKETDRAQQQVAEQEIRKDLIERYDGLQSLSPLAREQKLFELRTEKQRMGCFANIVSRIDVPWKNVQTGIIEQIKSQQEIDEARLKKKLKDSDYQ